MSVEKFSQAFQESDDFAQWMAEPMDETVELGDIDGGLYQTSVIDESIDLKDPKSIDQLSQQF